MTLHRFLIAVGTIAVLAACGEEDAPPAAAPSAPRAKPAVAALSGDGGVPAEVVQYIYSYNPVGKRDPFRSPIGEKTPTGAADQTVEVCPEPLCAFDLEQLVLVAVVSGDANPVAMLESPDKVGHIVRRNTKVGKQGGKVTQILRDCVVITEYFMTPDGKKNPNRVNLCVKKDDVRDRTFDLFNNKNVE